LKVLYSRVQNQALPVNIIRCDLTKRNHNEYIFTIFHRLNSGGIKLNNQEIRNCIYSGPFNELLRSLDELPDWRRMNHMRENDHYRFTKQETILRFFAFGEREDKYRGSISKFLNDYMFDNRRLTDADCEQKSDLFKFVCEILGGRILDANPPPRMPSTVLEAAMIGIAFNRGTVENLTDAELKQRFEALRGHQSLSAEYLAEGLSKPDRVAERLKAARAIFGDND